MKKITLLVCAMLLALTISAQTKGIISGQIIDENNLPLPGASVVIENLKIGSTSDFNGNYTILNIDEGTYNLKVTYLGYKTEIKEINVSPNKTTVTNFKLVVDTNELNEVFLGSLGVGQAKALNQQKTNLNITNIVAADQVGKFPDANIGDALKRIPGISMQNDQGEARDIIIRGLAPQLNSVTLNGDRIPSAEGDNRRVQMDLIPSDMIQAVEVNKAITSDMEADAIGGSVNLVTRSAPSNFRATITGAAGANPVRNKPLYNVSTVVAGRMFDNKLGAVVSASLQSNDYGSDDIEFEWDGDFENPYVSEHDIRKYDVRRDRLSLAANLDYKINDKNTIFFKSIFNKRKDWENRYRLRIKDIEEVSDGVYEGEVQRQTKGGTEKNARLEDQEVQKYSISGAHILFNSVEFDWKANYSEASEDRPNERYITYRNKDVKFRQDLSKMRFPELKAVDPYSYTNPSAFEFKELTENHNYTKEENYGFRADFKIPLTTVGNYKNKLKAGYKYKNKEKSRDNIFYEYEPLEGFELLSDVPYKDQTVGGFLPGDKYKSGFFVRSNYLGNLDLTNSSLFEESAVLEEFVPVNYNAEEEVNAAYVMFQQDLGEKLTVIAGVRFEDTNIDYTGYRIDIETAESINDAQKLSATKSYNNFLPNVQVKYNFTENTILRFAYTNSIARPNYYDLVPYQFINSDDLEFEEGNPNLKATESMNFDLMFEHYFSSVGILSAGAFYKDLDNWIYDYRQDGYVDSAFPDVAFEYKQARNGKNAEVYGFEVALQRKLNFLPSFLRNLNLYLNYTYTDSETDGIEDRNDVPLAGAVENMFNGSLSYETKKFSVRASLNYADDYIDEYGGEAFEDRYYDSQLFLDINASCEIINGLQLFTEFKNITNQELRYYQGTKKQTMQAEYYDFNWNVGLKYNF